MNKEKVVQPQAEVKNRQKTVSEWLMGILAYVASFYRFYIYENDDTPDEMTISVDVFPDLQDKLEDYNFKAKGNTLSFTYNGADNSKSGYTHLHLLEDPFSNLDAYNRHLAVNALQLNTRSPDFLVSVQSFLKSVAPNAELFMWVSNSNVLHITSLSKNPGFKRFLKMQGLV